MSKVVAPPSFSAAELTWLAGQILPLRADPTRIVVQDATGRKFEVCSSCRCELVYDDAIGADGGHDQHCPRLTRWSIIRKIEDYDERLAGRPGILTGEGPV